jgi:hypothetical protein
MCCRRPKLAAKEFAQDDKDDAHTGNTKDASAPAQSHFVVGLLLPIWGLARASELELRT